MTEQRPIAVLGGGSFGTAVANLLAENGHAVRQWMRDPEQAEAIRVHRAVSKSEAWQHAVHLL